MFLIGSRAALCWIFLIAPALSAAQQNVPPKPGALRLAEPAAAKAAAVANVEKKAATPVDRRMVLVGKEQELFAGLALNAQQKAQLQRNLGSLSCVPSGTVMPQVPGTVMMQTMPSPGGTGSGLAAAPMDECLSSTLDARQLAAFRAHLASQLGRLGHDVAAFERGVPDDCPLSQLKYYLTVLSQI